MQTKKTELLLPVAVVVIVAVEIVVVVEKKRSLVLRVRVLYELSVLLYFSSISQAYLALPLASLFEEVQEKMKCGSRSYKCVL